MAKRELRHVGGSFTAFHRVLEGWCDLQSKYAAIEGEPAYDNSEAANTSLLVSSANALHGWTGLAELWVERQHIADVDDADSGKRGRGLLDAYFATEDRGYVVELKQAWIKLKQDETAINSDSYTALLNQAETQIEQLNFEDGFASGEEFIRMHGAFLVPTYDPTKRKLRRREIFESVVAHCKQHFDAFAVFAPALSRRDCTRDEHNSCRPLVALALNVHCDDK